MALLMLEGFDDGFAQSRNLWTTLTTVGPTYKRVGANGVSISASATRDATYSLSDSTPTTCVVGFAFRKVSNNQDPETILELKDGSGVHLQIRRRTNGALFAVYPGGTGADTATGIVPLSTWVYIEVKLTVDNTTGSYEIKVDEDSVISGTSLDTQAGSNTYTDVVHWVGTAAGHSWEAYLDDIYILDDTTSSNNDFLGDMAVVTLYPVDNGNTSGMVGSDGDQIDNYLLVNEVVPSSTGYVQGDIEGSLDTYVMGSLGTTGSTSYHVHGVMTTVWGAKVDSGVKYLRHVIRTGTTGGAQSDNGSAVVPLTTSYVIYDTMWDTNPVTSTGWTHEQIEAFEVGQEGRDS